MHLMAVGRDMVTASGAHDSDIDFVARGPPANPKVWEPTTDSGGLDEIVLALSPLLPAQSVPPLRSSDVPLFNLDDREEYIWWDRIRDDVQQACAQLESLIKIKVVLSWDTVGVSLKTKVSLDW
jgi:hypothetical protein